MLAKGFNCGPSLGEYRTVGTGESFLELNDHSQRGAFYHSLIELWLEKVKQHSTFPIIHEKELKPSFKDFFKSGNHIRDLLFEKKITTSSQFTTFFNKFYAQCLIEEYLHAVVEVEGIHDLLIEQEFPRHGVFFLDEGEEINLRGRPDCVLTTSKNTYVLDWKTTIDEERIDYYNIQMYLYQSLVNSNIENVSFGRIISILEAADEENPRWPDFKSSEDFSEITHHEIVQSSLSKEKKPGEWCQNCKYNLKFGEVCGERGNDLHIVECTKRLFDSGFNPSSFIDVEFEKRHLQSKGRNLWIYQQSEEKAILFKFKVNTLTVGDKIRCRGSIQNQRNSERVFHVQKFVTF